MNTKETLLEQGITRLRTRLLVMCATVEEAVANACKALCDGNMKLAREVIDADEGINNLENEIDEMALSLIVRSQPVARDLCFIVSALRMVVDLERIGDEAVQIAESSLLMENSQRLPDFELIGKMMSIAQKALNDSITAFREEDVQLALQVCRGKDGSCEQEVRLLQKMMALLAETASEKNAVGCPALHITLVARSLSRIFGRASNIAEHCYFMKQGVSIKHKKAATPDTPGT